MIVNIGDRVTLNNGYSGVVEYRGVNSEYPFRVMDTDDGYCLCDINGLGECSPGACEELTFQYSVRFIHDRWPDLEDDAVNHPKHYQSESGLEAIDVLEAFFFNNGLLWNCVKYLLRAGKKDDTLRDLRKAEWYLQREIDRLEEVEDE